MASPSILGDVASQVSYVRPYSTSTARFFVRTSDTGTVATTGQVIDLSKGVHLSTTGGKPLDATVHRRNGGPPRWRGVKLSVPLELVYHTSGLNTFVTVAHKCRAATSGAGSTFRTLKTDVFRFKMGTDTDATFHLGLASSCNLQGSDRFYKANVTFSWKTATGTAAKDTTTSQELICNSPVYEFVGHDMPNTSVPFKVS